MINLGIKVPPEELIAAYRAHKPDAFGLRGLLVKSAQQMVVTAQDLREAGIEIPLFVGGAALTRKFTATRIAAEYGGVTLYAKDAMDGLDLANQLFSAVTRDALVERVRPRAGRAGRRAPRQAAPAPVSAPSAPITRVPAAEVPTPPDLERHVLRDVPLTHIYPYLNLQMLYGKHLGLRGPVLRLLEQADPKALELQEVIEGLKTEAVRERLFRAHGVYQWFRARAAGDAAHALRRRRGDGRALRLPAPAGRRAAVPELTTCATDRDDYVALFAVTCGAGVRERATEARSGATTCAPTRCRRWPSRAPRPWPSGCTRGCARCGGSPIRPS